MSNYDETLFVPPAPLARVILRNPATQTEIVNVPMLIDTGADATLIPQKFAEKLDLFDSAAKFFEIEGFDKSVSRSRVVSLQMIFEGKSFRGEFLTIEEDYGIIGRNVLNSLKLLLDGQNLRWEIL
jgi:predicted aspartyl protease